MRIITGKKDFNVTSNAKFFVSRSDLLAFNNFGLAILERLESTNPSISVHLGNWQSFGLNILLLLVALVAIVQPFSNTTVSLFLLGIASLLTAVCGIRKGLPKKIFFDAVAKHLQ